ncbi:MAG: hypothetical protein R2764_16840 [Bacteroidales bacterium]
MKTTIFFGSMIMISFISLGQSRLDNWPVEEFTSVTVNSQYGDLHQDTFTSKDPKIIKMVFDYLHRIELKTFNPLSDVFSQNTNDWNFIIRFNDWQDEFRIYDDHALVGKSTYVIRKDVSDKFFGFYKRLATLK